MGTVNCPSCGAPVTLRASLSLLVVCEYCRSTLLRRDRDLENIGKMADLQQDATPLQLHAEGKYRHVHFAVLGRIQLRFAEGLWNEWYLLFDDQRDGWLGEAQGTYAVSFLTECNDRIPAFGDLQVGQGIVLMGKPYEVQNLEAAFCIAGEGELPFPIGAGYEAPVADLIGPESLFATLDYSEEKPLVFLGEYVDFDDLHLTGLREFDGW